MLYSENQPCPHILLQNSLESDVTLAIAREFPSLRAIAGRNTSMSMNKLGLPRRDLFPPALRAVTDELNSPEVVAWVGNLTGIPGLIADPSLEGGELHQSGPGGYLNVHTDLSKHHVRANWRRRIDFDSVVESGVGRELGRVDRILGEISERKDDALRREISAALKSCADLHH